MALNTNTYGYVIDPLFSFCDQGGKTIANGYVRVFLAGTSTPVLTYRNFDGALNAETIELDNSGRTMTQVIASKGNLYKVCVYDAEHSQEDPILTVDKVAVIGSSVNATNIVTGLDSVTVQEENFLKATVAGTDVELTLDPTEVTSDVNTISAAETAAPDYVLPLLDKTGTGDGKKISLANLFKFALDWISRLATTVTSFASGDFIAVSNTTNGARKMSKDTLLQLTAQNALAGNVAPEFVPNETNAVAGMPYVYGGQLYVAKQNYTGAWDATKFVSGSISSLSQLAQSKEFSIVGANLTGQNVYIPLCRGINKIKVKATPNPWPTDTIGGTNPNILIIYGVAADGTKTAKKQYSITQSIPEEILIDVSETDLLLSFFVRANNGSKVSFSVVNDVQGQIDVLESEISSTNTSVSELALKQTASANYVFGSSLSFDGKGSTAVSSDEYEVSGLSEVVVDFSANGSWPVTSLTSVMQKFWIQAYNGSWATIAEYPKDSTDKKFSVRVGIDVTKVRFSLRCDSGTTLSCVLSCDRNPLSFKLRGKGQTLISNLVRVKPNTEYYLVSDGSWSIDGISNNSNVLAIYSLNESAQNVTLLSQTQAPSRPASRIRFVTPYGCEIIKIEFRCKNGDYVQFNLSDNFPSLIDFEDYGNLVSLRKYNGYQIPSLLLMGDPHSDDKAYNDYLDIVNTKLSAIDCVIVLGDMANDYPTQSGTYDNYKAFVNSSSLPVYPVIGNHDVGSSYGLDHYAPMSDIVDNIMSDAVARGFIPSAPNGYYYVDIGTAWNYKTRVIVLNNYNIAGTYDPDSKWERVAYDSNAPSIAYDTSYNANDIVNVGVWTDYSYKAKENVTTPASSPTSLVHTFPCWSVRPDYANIDAVQAQWLLDTMESTPNYTGIVIVQHSTLATLCTKDLTNKFTQQGNASLEVSGIGDFLVNAAKAFDDKSASFSATIHGVSVSKDFSSRKATASFVGFVGGHQHHDYILRSTTYPKYYEVCANKSKLSYAGDNSDIFTSGSLPSATFVSVNRETMTMNLAKIGVQYTQDGYKRDIDVVKQEVPANWS